MSRPTPASEPVAQKSAPEPRVSEPESKKSSVEDRRSASKKEQQEKELAALAEYRKQYFQEKQAAAMKNKAVVDDQIGRPTNTEPPPSQANPAASRSPADNAKKPEKRSDEKDDGHDPYKLVKPPSLEKLKEHVRQGKKESDALSASDAEKRHEEFLKWKSEQQKLAKQKKKDMEIEVLESPIKNKPDEAEQSASASPSSPSNPATTQENFSQGLPTEDPSEIVHNKTTDDVAQDINDYEDMMNNMREVLSQTDSSTIADQEVPEELDEEQESEEPMNGGDESPNSNNSFSKFTLLGATLRLPNVSDRDSLMYRIESLRLFLEDKLGMDVFMKVYHLLNDTESPPSLSSPPSSSTSSSTSSSSSGESSVDDEIARLLSEDQMPLLSLIHQLIFCEDRMYDS